MKLSGKVAIVTGGGSGIGESIALLLANNGASLVIADIDLGMAKRVCKKIESCGSKARAIKVDVSNNLEVINMVERTIEAFKRIDILVNNAGISQGVPLEELTESVWDRVLDVNLKGTFLCCKAVAPHMIKEKHGKIVNIASTSAYRGAPDRAAYCASKGGVIQLTKSLAINWAKYNINVNAVSPGITVTPILEKADKGRGAKAALERWEKVLPLKRVNQPEDIANAVLFMVSPESDNVTGQDIIVDGGLCALHPAFISML